MSSAHVIYDPEWTIDERGDGSFRIECQCGWETAGYDTASLARAAGFAHSTGGGPPSSDAPAEDTGKRKRFWQR
jgi:hypothetical protein